MSHTPGQFYNSPARPACLQPQSSVQMLSQELAASQRKLSQYTDLISNLYAELEMIRNIVCQDCKQRISPTNLAQYSGIPNVAPAESQNLGSQQTVSAISTHNVASGAPIAFASPFPKTHDILSPQMNLPNTKQTTSYPPPIPATLSRVPITQAISSVSSPITETFLAPPAPRAESVGAIVPEPPDETFRWSVTYNSEIERSLDVTFVHAFEHTSSVDSTGFSRDAKFLAAGLTSDLGRAQIYDVENRSIRCVLAEYCEPDKSTLRFTWDVWFTPDGRHLVVGGTSGMLYIWKIASKRLQAAFKRRQRDSSILALDLSPDGRLLVSGSSGGSIDIWKMRDGSSKPLTSKSKDFTSVRFSPDGRYVAAANGDQYLWEVRSGNLIGSWSREGDSIRYLTFTLDGEELVSGSENGMIMSWDVKSRARPAVQVLEESVGEDDFLKEKREFDALEELLSIAVSPDAKWVLTASLDSVRVWNLHTGVQQCVLNGHAERVWAVDFSPVENYIATGSEDGFMTLWRYEPV